MRLPNQEVSRGLNLILKRYKGVEASARVPGGFRVWVQGKSGFVATWKVETVERELDRVGSLGPSREALEITFDHRVPRGGRNRRRDRGRDRR